MAFSGADTRIRTGDLVITNDALYQLSYISTLLANDMYYNQSADIMQVFFTKNVQRET